jgi:ribokinase
LIAVLGSANIDVVTEVPRFPRPGETVLGKSVHRYPGGKGANQAVAAARVGGAVRFYGKVGADAFGDELLALLQGDGVDISAVERTAEAATGMASILVDEAGENSIVYTPGANACVDPAYVDRVFEALREADVLLMQFEIPLETVAHLLARLPRQRPIVIVDPAPAHGMVGLPLDRIDVLTPNRSELLALTGVEDVLSAARALIGRGVRAVLCKAGADGALWMKQDAMWIPAETVEPVDTTAAGDAFNGTLACLIAEWPIDRAIRWANAAGALATTRRGAQPSLPRVEEIRKLLDEPGWPPATGGSKECDE